VPGIAWWPERIKPGMVSRETVMTMDLMPTFLELADLSIPPSDSPRALDGISLKPLLFRGKPLPKRILFWRSQNLKAVRKGPWKLVKRNTQNPELYNLDEDTGEQNDIAARHPELVQQLLAALGDWLRDVDKSYTVHKTSRT
jgi:arylsulfatase A-like enzyme